MEVFERLRDGYRLSSILMKIVWVNVAVFVLLRLAAIVCVFSGSPDFIDVILSQVELPSSAVTFLTRPWTLLTYMFAQYDLLHLVFNMLWLYWFGTMFTISRPSSQLAKLYLAGGLAGGVLYMIGNLILPSGVVGPGSLIGSSAAVIAIVTAVAILMPHFRMHLLFLGSVSVKWIAIVTIVLVLIGVTGNNAGGEIAHIGGVLAGAGYALWIKKFPGWRWRSNLFTKKSGPDTASESIDSTGGLTKEDRYELDRILDKIKKSGYTSLTQIERDRLFNVSRKIK